MDSTGPDPEMSSKVGSQKPVGLSGRAWTTIGAEQPALQLGAREFANARTRILF